jgi:hypothetical protein
MMANSTEKNEEQMFNSSDQFPNSPPRNASCSITQDDASLTTRKGL